MRDDVLAVGAFLDEANNAPELALCPLEAVENWGHVVGDVVLICRAGPRAERAQQALARAGLTNTAVLTGGFEAWRDGGQAVEYGEARWDLERQVRLVAGSLVASGVLASTVVPKAKWLSGAVGGGLVFAALSNTCAMGNLLGRLPYNRGAGTPTLEQVTARLR